MTLEEKIAQLFAPDGGDLQQLKYKYANTSVGSIGLSTTRLDVRNIRGVTFTSLSGECTERYATLHHNTLALGHSCCLLS